MVIERKPTTMDKTVTFLEEKLRIPGRDNYDLLMSEKRFPDSAQYRFELSDIQSPDAMKAGLEEADKRGLVIHRVTETMGIMHLTDSEIKEMVALAKESQIELILSIGPRAPYDISAGYRTITGARVAHRLRGADQLARGIEDMKRAISFGCRGIMVYDEGMLWVANEMRKAGEIPSDIHFKVSSHVGYGNPAAMRLLEMLGANSINPIRDLALPMIASLRQGCNVPLSLLTSTPEAIGAFIRDYEAAEWIRVAAPVYLEVGGYEISTHAYRTTGSEARALVKRIELVQRLVNQYYPEGVRSARGSKDMATSG